MERAKGARNYLTHIPVRSHLEADILSKESTWNILGFVKSGGPKGVSADEVARHLDLPASAVYSTLKELRRLEFVSILPRSKQRKGERKRRYVCERSTWGRYRIDGSFLDAMAYEGITKRLKERLERPLLDVFSELFEEIATKPKLRPYLPVPAEGRICPICGRSHEATEFAYAAILAAIDPFITESPEFHELLLRKGYAR